MKGLGNVNSGFKKFIDGAIQQGYDYDEIRNFIGEKVEKSEKNIPKQYNNLIEKESPELHKYLLEEIKKGRKPIEAGAVAQNDKRFSDIIKNLMKKHKTPWSSIIESIFGSGDMALPQQMQQPAQQRMQQQKSLDPSIQAALQKIMQM